MQYSTPIDLNIWKITVPSFFVIIFFELNFLEVPKSMTFIGEFISSDTNMIFSGFKSLAITVFINTDEQFFDHDNILSLKVFIPSVQRLFFH